MPLEAPPPGAPWPWAPPPSAVTGQPLSSLGRAWHAEAHAGRVPLTPQAPVSCSIVRSGSGWGARLRHGRRQRMHTLLVGSPSLFYLQGKSIELTFNSLVSPTTHPLFSIVTSRQVIKAKERELSKARSGPWFPPQVKSAMESHVSGAASLEAVADHGELGTWDPLRVRQPGV